MPIEHGLDPLKIGGVTDMQIIHSNKQMKRLIWALVALSAIFCVGARTGAAAEAEKAGRMVRIKVAEYQTELTLTCPEGGTWQAEGKRGTIAPGAGLRLVGRMDREAVKTYHVVVESAPLRDRARVVAAQNKWGNGTKPLHTVDMGKISYAEDGTTVKYDGRVRMFALGKFDRRDAAQVLVDELARGSQSSWILEEILQPAHGRVQVLANDVAVAETSGEVVVQPKESVTLAKVEFAKGFQWHGFADRTYRGDLSVGWGGQNALDAVITCDLERVLAGVVPSEISSKAATGALQAQAVAARGEILSKIGLRHCNEGFDTCAEQHCQVYAGDTPVARQIAPIIAPTRGLILQAPDGAIVDAVYAANCGGHSEANHLVWTTSPDPMLAGKWDGPTPKPKLDLTREADVKKFIRTPPKSYCNDKTVEGGDKYRWKTPLLGDKWKKVEEAAGVGRIREIKDFTRGVSGRLYKLTVVGESGTKTIMKELNIRKLFGMLRSACFIATWHRDRAGFIDGAVFEGAGWGHGVGMCQTGAQSLAKKGWTFKKILAHYFPGSRLVKAY